MSVYKKKSRGKIHLYGRTEKGEEYIGPIEDPSKWDNEVVKKIMEKGKDRINESLTRYVDGVELLSSAYPTTKREEYLSDEIKILNDKIKSLYKLVPVPSTQIKSKGKQKAEEPTRLRRPIEKIVVYGLTHEAYLLASSMAMKHASVSIIDESNPSAISLNEELVIKYPTFSFLLDGEPLLKIEPIDKAIAKSKYLFFSPRLKEGRGMKHEIESKLADAVSSLKKNSTLINCLQSTVLSHEDCLDAVERFPGLKVGKNFSYYYYPLNPYEKIPPTIIGHVDNKRDETLLKLLSTVEDDKKISKLQDFKLEKPKSIKKK